MPRNYEPKLGSRTFLQQAREQFNCSEYKAILDSIEQAIAIHPYYQEAWYL